MKRIFKLLFTIFILVNIICISSCSSKNSNESNSNSSSSNVCIVSFNSNGGTNVSSQEVAKGDKATKPIDPTRDGYIFDGWYYQGEKWSFVGYTVTEDMELEAKWLGNYYQLNISKNIYDAYDYISDSASIRCGESVTITAIVNSNHTFLGWYENDTLISPKPDYTFVMPAKNTTYEARCVAKESYSGITEKNVDMQVASNYKSNVSIKLTFTENENLSSGAAKCYVMAYKFENNEETNGIKQNVNFSGGVYTSSIITFSNLVTDQEYHFVLYVTYKQYDSRITTITAKTSAESISDISTTELFKEVLTDDTDGEFKVVEDLDFSIDGEPQILNLFTTESKAFKGLLDGGIYDENDNLIGCHKISNFKIGSATHSGLFGYLKNATIKNLIIENVSVDFTSKATSNIGVLAGYAIESLVENVTIKNVTFEISTQSSAQINCGGVVGYSERTAFYNVYAEEVNINFISAKHRVNVGLFAGKITGDAITYVSKNCGAKGEIKLATECTSSSDTGAFYIGGFIGSLGSSGLIEYCYSNAEVTISTKRQNGRTYDVYVGGFVGANGPDSTAMNIKNCLAVLNISAYAGPISTEEGFDYNAYCEDYYLATNLAYIGGFIGKANATFNGIFDSYTFYKKYPITVYADSTRNIENINGEIRTEDVLFVGDFYGEYNGTNKDIYLPNCDNHNLYVSSISEDKIPDNFTDIQKNIIREFIQ